MKAFDTVGYVAIRLAITLLVILAATHLIKGARLEKKETKSITLGIRVKPSEKKEWTRAASKDSRTLSDWVQLTVNESLDKKKRRTSREQKTSEDAEALASAIARMTQ